MHFVVGKGEGRGRGETCNWPLFISEPIEIGCCWDLNLNLRKETYVQLNRRASCETRDVKTDLILRSLLYVQENSRDLC